MERMQVHRSDDGEWDDKVDWNVNETDNAQFPSDKEILADGLVLKQNGLKANNISAFAVMSTLHGFYYIFGRGHHPVRRVIWGILLLVMIIIVCTGIFSLVRFYLYYIHITEIREVRTTKMKFPAVSICNLNGMKFSLMNGTELDRELKKKFTWMRSRGFINGSFYKFAQEAGHELKDMLQYCGFHRYKCSPQNFSVFSYRYIDNCFTFNSGDAGHKQMFQKYPGRYGGLRMTLNIEHFEYYLGAREAGLRVIIHEQGDLPLRKSGIILSPGTTNHIILKRKHVKRLMKPYASGCESIKLKYFKKYTIGNCWIELMSRRIIRKCGCKMYFMKGNAPTCKGRQLRRCVYPYWRKISRSTEYLQKCPYPCEYDMYSATPSSALYPSNIEGKRMAAKMNMTGTTEENLNILRQNYLRMYVFYDDFHYEERYEWPIFRSSQLFAAAGSLVVIYLGASVLTFFEFGDFLAMTIIRAISKYRRTSNYPSRF